MEVSFLEEDTCTEVLRELVPPTRILSLASHGALVFEISHQKQEALDLRSSASTNISWHTVNMHCKEEKEVMPGRKTRNVSVLQETSMSTIMIVAGSSMVAYCTSCHQCAQKAACILSLRLMRSG
jgi:hypothetical protein